MSSKGYVPISLLGFVFILLILPVVVFLVGQKAGTFDTRNKAFEGDSGPAVAQKPGTVTDDAYVDADVPTKNLGPTQVLWADGASQKVAYLKFDLLGLAGKTISSAILKLKVTQGSQATEQVLAVADGVWTEQSITFANRPEVGAVIGRVGPTRQGEWVEVNLTDYARVHLGQTMSIAIASSDPNGLGFSSKESQGDGPELVIK